MSKINSPNKCFAISKKFEAECNALTTATINKVIEYLRVRVMTLKRQMEEDLKVFTFTNERTFKFIEVFIDFVVNQPCCFIVQIFIKMYQNLSKNGQPYTELHNSSYKQARGIKICTHLTKSYPKKGVKFYYDISITFRTIA